MKGWETEPGRGGRKVALLITPVVAVLTGLLVAHYAFHVQFFHREAKDPNLGKYAYSKWNGQYLGRVEGAKQAAQEWVIREPAGALIGVAKFRVELSDLRPGPPDDLGRSFKPTSGKPPDH